MLDVWNVDDRVHLKCHVVGYEFPEKRDDNWCLVRVEVRQDSESFEKVDPALEATELLLLRDWFRCLANDRLPRYANLTFTEPCLGFEFLARDAVGVRFAVHLDFELKPDFPLRQLSYSTNDWQVVFHLSFDRLTVLLDSIEATILKFPVRG
jgi:hypothetical protein